MRILVVYASKHGATRGIAERITQTFQRLGMEAESTLQMQSRISRPPLRW